MSAPQCKLQLSDVLMLLGNAKDTAGALHLDLLRVEQRYLPWQEQLIPAAYLTELPFGAELSERLLELIGQFISHYGNELAGGTIYLVLPELNDVTDSQLTAFLKRLMQRQTQFLLAPQCRVFPYGSAGGLMALSAAQEALSSDPTQHIWLVGADTLIVPQLVEQHCHTPIAHQLSEGVVALKLSSSKAGFVIETASDASFNPETEPAVAALFNYVAQSEREPLAHICLPDSGNEAMLSGWSMHYQNLRPVLTEATELLFPGYVTGELGAAGGLYRLAYLLDAYTSGRVNGRSLMLEMSAKSYRAVAVIKQQTAFDELAVKEAPADTAPV